MQVAAVLFFVAFFAFLLKAPKQVFALSMALLFVVMVGMGVVNILYEAIRRI